MEKEACRRLLSEPTPIFPSEIKGSISKSLFHAWWLAKELKDELQDKKWEAVIGRVWVQMVSLDILVTSKPRENVYV